MSADSAAVADRLIEAGRAEVTARLRDALAELAAEAGVSLAAAEVDRLAAEAVGLADATLWRRALAGAAAAELGLGLAEALAHPVVAAAQERLGAPPPEEPSQPPEELSQPPEGPSQPPEGTSPPAPENPPPEAVRVAAVHLGGIEALRAGERDIELRFSAAGLDVLRRSSGDPVGRLDWQEVRSVELPRPRRGLRPGRRRGVQLHVATDRGRASFELPDVSEEQLTEHLEPVVAWARGGPAGIG